MPNENRDFKTTDDLRELLKKAIPGPWRKEGTWAIGGRSVTFYGGPENEVVMDIAYEDEESASMENIDLAIAAVNALPVLLDEIERTRQVMDAFEAEEKAGRYSCECEWAPDEYTTQVCECVTHAALNDYKRLRKQVGESD